MIIDPLCPVVNYKLFGDEKMELVRVMARLRWKVLSGHRKNTTISEGSRHGRNDWE